MKNKNQIEWFKFTGRARGVSNGQRLREKEKQVLNTRSLPTHEVRETGTSDQVRRSFTASIIPALFASSLMWSRGGK